MTESATTRKLSATWLIAAAVALAALGLEIAYRLQTENAVLSVADLLWTFVPVPFAALGALITSRQPGNRIGLILLAIGAGMTLSNLGDAVFFFIDEPPTAMSPALFAALWYNNVAWATFFFPMFLLLYVFPTGSLLSRRWMWAPRLALALFGLLVVSSLVSEEIGPTSEAWVMENPIGFVGVDSFEPVFLVFLVGVLVLLAGGAVAMVVRYRRAPSVEREQIKWVLFGFFVFAMTWVIAFLLESWGSGVVGLLLVLGISVIPAVITIAVLRFRLYDIDVVISKTVTYGVLAAFITAVYAVIVVGVGSLAGGGDEPSLALSITAVAVVAVAFEPVRGRVQHWANVVVYGKRATPYEVLASATARLSDTSDPDEALARVTQLVVDGTGAVEAVLWLKVGGVLYPRASSPEDVVAGLGPAAGEDPVVALPGDRVVAVRHRGDVLGALSISKGRADAVTGSDEKVLEDVAAGAGVLLRNMGLNAELAERADQLRVSRRRLVAAHDGERRRLERDLHDGAQQQVVALKVKLGIARTLAEREGAGTVAGLVASLSDTTQEAVDGMRAVAHGIYPPLLESEGLEAALGGMRRTVPIPVGITAVAVSRYERSVEESVYFCVVEVVAKAVDAGANRIDISLTGTDAGVGFVVASDVAVADLQALEDRVAAFDGSLEVSSQDPRWAITGSLPNNERSMEPA